MTSNEIKKIILSSNTIIWNFAVPEVTISGTADIFGQRLGGDWIEIEIKLTLSDLKAERKKIRHHPNNSEINYSDYRYFCVSENIAEKAIEYIKSNYPNYGIYVCDGKEIVNVHRAKRLNRTSTIDLSIICIYLYRRYKTLLNKQPEGRS